MKLHHPAAICVALLWGWTVLPGCSSGHDYGPTGRVTGRLTMDGAPLSAGSGVCFMEPMAGFLAFGMTDADGKFSVDSWNEGNLPVGKYKVWLASPPGAAPREMTSEERMDHPELAAEPKVRLEFPRKYVDKKTSGLEFDVKEGDNHFDINVEGLKKK